MQQLHRRAFLAAAGAASHWKRLFAAETGSASVDATLRDGIARRRIPAVAAMAATDSKTLYTGAFGVRDASGVPVRPDSLFQIASMTKAITTTAALQLVEQGKVDLAEPVSKHLPKLADLDVLEGFDADGRPKLRRSAKPVTLHHLLTHTSGFCYDVWDGDMFRYTSSKPEGYTKPGPLMFEPGRRWQYGQGIDWAGRLVEAISGRSLEDYFQQNILQPLGMVDTSYIMPEQKFDRMVTRWHRNSKGEGPLEADLRKMPPPPKEFNGGGGLYSTPGDYIRFTQMILNRGAGPNGARILQAKTVESIMRNQIGSLTAGKMKTFRPATTAAVDIQPGHTEKWTYGFLLNTAAYKNGRSAGSLAWAGINNTFYWIDPKRRICGVIMMQFQPFVDREAIGLLSDFESSIYRNFT